MNAKGTHQSGPPVTVIADLNTNLIRRGRRGEGQSNFLLQLAPVGLDLLLDARVVHDLGGIKGVAEEIALLLLVPAELFAQIRVLPVEPRLFKR